MLTVTAILGSSLVFAGNQGQSANACASKGGGRFTVFNDGTVKDALTGYKWRLTTSDCGEVTWNDALAKKPPYDAGYKIPSASEINTLFDDTGALVNEDCSPLRDLPDWNAVWLSDMGPVQGPGFATLLTRYPEINTTQPVLDPETGEPVVDDDGNPVTEPYNIPAHWQFSMSPKGVVESSGWDGSNEPKVIPICRVYIKTY